MTYTVLLSDDMEREFTRLSNELGITKEEIFRRALVLFCHVAHADGVQLTTDGEEINVLIK